MIYFWAKTFFCCYCWYYERIFLCNHILQFYDTKHNHMKYNNIMDDKENHFRTAGYRPADKEFIISKIIWDTRSLLTLVFCCYFFMPYYCLFHHISTQKNGNYVDVSTTMRCLKCFILVNQQTSQRYYDGK